MLLEAMDQRAEQAAHRPNAGLIRDQIRPLVTEAMRLESDTDMRRMVQELKVRPGQCGPLAWASCGVWHAQLGQR